MMQETTNGMLMEFSCVHNRIFLCVGRKLSNTLIFSFSVWNMISMKDAPHIRDEYAIRISSTYMLLLYLKGKCYRQEIWNSVKYRATRESSFKSENWLWRTFDLSFPVFFMLFQSPEYCQSFEYFFMSVSYFDEKESLYEDTEIFFLPTY